MGLYAGGGLPDIPSIAAAMRPALYAWFTGHLQLIDPKSETITRYDSVADSGGVRTGASVVFDSGPGGALIQPIRAAGASNFGDQSVGIQGIRFQTTLDLSFVAKSGLVVKVLDGGEDSTLTAFQYALLNGVDSSLAWGRIYEARAVMS